MSNACLIYSYNFVIFFCFSYSFCIYIEIRNTVGKKFEKRQKRSAESATKTNSYRVNFFNVDYSLSSSPNSLQTRNKCAALINNNSVGAAISSNYQLVSVHRYTYFKCSNTDACSECTTLPPVQNGRRALIVSHSGLAMRNCIIPCC